MENICAKGIDAFDDTGCTRIYGREQEKQAIRSFLEGDSLLLHITGRPGTGKSCTVKSVLGDRAHLYINYLHEGSVAARLRRSTADLVVIDEFDRYFSEKKSECTGQLATLRRRKVKLVTISNNLQMKSLRFEGYRPPQIEAILREKMQAEIGCVPVEPAALKLIARTYGRNGDLRAVFRCTRELLAKLDAGHPAIAIGDVITETTASTDRSIQREIIRNALENKGEAGSDAYARYLKECAAFRLPVLNRQEFTMLCEVMENETG